ncbi:MAG: hypothetical protein ACLPWO_08195 [Thermoplasmata archaeon]
MQSSTGSIIFREPSGTYPFFVSSVSGYEPNRTSGIVVVRGGPQSVTVTYTNTSKVLDTNLSWGVPVNATGVLTLGCASTVLYCYTIEIAGASAGLTTSDFGLLLWNAVGATVAWTSETISLVSPLVETPVATYSTTTSSWTLVGTFTGLIAGGFYIVIQPAAATHADGLLGDQLVAVGENGYSGSVPSIAFP